MQKNLALEQMRARLLKLDSSEEQAPASHLAAGPWGLGGGQEAWQRGGLEDLVEGLEEAPATS